MKTFFLFTLCITMHCSLVFGQNNLALNGTAEQSSTESGGLASRAIDGNTNGAWSGGSVTHTTAEDYAWWDLTLDSEATIDEIVIYNRTDDCCKDRLSDFVVFIWDESGTRTLRKFITTTPDPSVTIDVGGLQGNRIRIKSNLLATPLNLAEVEVYGTTTSVGTIGPWDMDELFETPSYRTTDVQAVDGMTSILYESIDYLDNKVEVYAYYSAPSGTMPSGGWPAVVYVHGGAGTALPEWVEYWNERGYACITMDHHGHYPDGSDTPNPGPDKIGNWGDWEKPIDEQWYYHAVAQVVKAHSLIASFDEVNANKIGIMGTSWGGTITSTVMGIDNRLRWAIPVYGGGYLSDSDGVQGQALSDPDVRAFVDANFDGRAYFSNVTIPTLWINGTNDTNFPMTVTKQSTSALNYPAKISYILRLKHNNTYVTSLDELGAFADEVIQGADALPEIGKPEIVSNTISATFSSSVGLSSANLLYTEDGDGVAWIDKQWQSVNATISGNTISRSVPANATVVYLTGTDTRGLTVSSDYILTDSYNSNENLALSGTAEQSSTASGALASVP